MKEFKKYVATRDEIDFSLEEKSGHVVYVPSKDKFDPVPGIVTPNEIYLRYHFRLQNSCFYSKIVKQSLMEG